MSARDDIFSNMRRSLGVSGKETTRHATKRMADGVEIRPVRSAR